MENLKELKEKHEELYNILLDNYDWKLTYNGKTLLEKGNNNHTVDFKFDNINSDKVIFEAKINDKSVLYLLEDNEAKKTFNKFYEGWSAEKFLENPTSFNNAMNMANSLPKFNIIEESNVDSTTWKLIKNHGSNFKTIIENLIIK